jgi:predicted MFS family arabinose efflux permease
MGIGIGIVFAGQLSDAARHGGGDGGWHDVYLIEGLIGLGVCVAAFLFLRVPPHPQPTPELPATNAGIAGFGALRRVHGWAPLTVAYAAFGFMYLLVLAFLVARLEDDSGFSADRASEMFSLVGVAAVFGGVLLGPLSDRIGRRTTMAAAFVGFAASTLAVLPGHQPLVAFGAVGIGLCFSGLPTVIAAFVVDGTDAVTYAPAYSAATLAFGLAQMAAPQVGGLIADAAGSFTPVLLLSVTVAIFGAVVAGRLPGTRHQAVIKVVAP